MVYMVRITEDEMVLEFLLAEVQSSRFFSALETALHEAGGSPDILYNPNLNDPDQNKIRKAILRQYRGYPDTLLFDGFPDDVQWYKKTLMRDRVLEIKYSTYSYWVALSKGTRSPKVGAQTVRNGEEIFNQPNQIYWQIVEKMKEDKNLPKLICVAMSESDTPVVIEGHLRLTAYALAPENLPRNFEILFGISTKLSGYGFYKLPVGAYPE